VPSKTTRLEHLLEAVPDALVGMDQKGVIRFVNRQTEVLFGYDRDQLIGRHIDTLVPETLYAVYAQHREDYFTDPRTRSSGLDLELTARMRDGTDLSVNISMSSIDTGDVLLVITARRDVTTQRRAVEGAQLTAAIVEFSDDAIIGTTLEGVVTSWNPAAARMYGYSREEVIGKYAGLLVPDGRAGETRASLAALRAGQAIQRLETIRVRKDGTEVSVSITVAPIRDEDGVVAGASAAHRDVTEQRKAFLAAQRLSAIIESSDDAIIGETLEGVITSWNPAAARMFGYSSSEIIGKTIALLVPEDQLAAAVAVMAEVGAGHHVDRRETSNVRRDGTVFPISLSISPILDDGTVVGASVICRDITEQKRAFQATQQMAAIVESSNDAIIGSTLRGVMTSWNPAAERMYGYSAAEVIGRSGKLLSPEDRIGEIKATLAKVRAGQHIEHLETIRVRKDGTTFPVSLTVSPILGEGGEVVGASAISRNMTELRHAARYTRGLIEAALDPLMTISPQGLINDVNEAAVKITGVSRDKLIGTDFAQYVTDPVKAGESFQQAFTHGPVKDIPLTLRSAGGTLTDVLCSASVYRDHNGDVLGVLATAHDTTEQTRALGAAQRMAAIVEGSQDAIISGSLDGVITSWNPAAEAMYGYSGQEILGRSIRLVIPSGRTGEIATILDRINEGQPVEDFETMRVRRDGTEFPVSLTISPIRDAGGAIVGTSAIHHDMTAYLRRLEIAQRLAAIVESSGDAIIGSTPDRIITSWNQGAEAMFGYSVEEMVGRSASLLIPEDQSAAVDEVGARVLAGNQVARFEMTTAHKDGAVLRVSLTVSPIFGPDGSVIGGSTICRDVTEQEHAAQYARSLIEAAMDPLMMIGLDGGISDLNEAAVKIIGLSREELSGSDFTQYVTEPDKADEVLRRVLAQGWVINAPLTVRHRNGTLTRALCNASAYRDSAGNVLGMLAVARDVTEHLMKDEAVQGLASMVEFIDEAIIGTTLDGTVTSWNPAATRMYGYSAEEVVGGSIRLLIPDDRADEVAVIMARVNAGQTVRGLETVRLCKDGTALPVSITVGPIRDSGGVIVGSTAIGRELT
jgi:PAS domain S-box-containing protein